MAEGRKGFWDEVAPKDKRKISREGLKKALQLLAFIKPYKWTFAIGMVFLTLSSASTLAFPMLIGEMTRVIEGKSKYTLNNVTMFFAGILLLQGLFSYFRVYFFSQVSEWTAADIRKMVYSKFITLPIHFFEQRRVGELTSRISSDVSSLQVVLSTTLAEFFRQIVTLIVGISIIIVLSWKLTLFMLATFPVLVIAAIVFGRYIRVLAKRTQDKLAESNVIVEETLQSVHIVKSFTNEKLEINRYKKVMGEIVETALKAAALRGGFITFFIVGMFGGIVGVVWYGGGLVEAGEMQLADLLTFLFYTTFIGGSLSGLGDLYAQLQRTVGSSERLLEIIEEKSEVNVDNIPRDHKINGEVSFENVSFNYPSRPDIEVLKDISFHVSAGEKVALVGQSGAGKSTIVQLLMKFYPLTSGTISVDGESIADQDVTDLRKNIAIVPQEVMLFGGTIMENILYGNPSASLEEVYNAARRANALQFIEKFPEKFDTVVGERGVKLSGGQRQRVAIARAILKDPAILLLDEATSALDSESEKLVQGALNELMKDRTTIIIAHRLATIRNVDRIYVIKEGEIAETGSHEELILKNDGIYANLVKLQFENASLVLE
ncbi:ATP-binding cassette domain-containing protein [Emticicia sp. CRIBPO]|uniref:ABC transporter ATP-binding protein n=1 Tax=Emticicia sp. CRIBPO TaxID=2683258 RepID=UPI001412A9B4|nr:ABC transporter transmembrane domain-containing protein [Emticicia sp. CRIBPO]NBA86732.1 ATP-binding cassette domain-containing protein [Emticicia sp. CRIBPO]